MADVAQLQIEISTLGAEKAARELRELTAEGKLTEDRAISLSGAIKVLSSSFLALSAYNATKEAVLLGARYEMLGATLGIMGNNVGKTRAEMDGFQQDLEKTGISALRARGAMQVMAAAQLDVSQSAKVARVAQDAATLAGINSSEAFNNLVRGMATGEVRIIRHMGIMVNFTDAYRRHAKELGVNVEAMTQTQKAEARLQEVIDQGAKRQGVYEAAMTTAGKQLLSMERYTENLKVQVGELFNPATNSLVFAFVEVLKNGSESMREFQRSGEAAAFAATLKDKVSTAVSAVRTLGTVLYDNREIVVSLGIAYTGLKLAPLVAQIWAKVAATSADILTTKAALVAKQTEAGLNLVQIQREYNLLAAKEAKIAAQIREAKAQIISNAVRAESAALTTAMILKEEQLAAAKLALAEATNAAAAAQSVAQRAVTALGGPIGVVILLITALVMAYRSLKDTTIEDVKAGSLASKDRMETLAQEIKRHKDFLEAVKKNGGDVKKAMKASFDPRDMPEIRQLDTEIGKLKSRLEELGNSTWYEKLGRSFWKLTVPMSPLLRMLGVEGKNTEEQTQEAQNVIYLKQYEQQQLARRNARKKELEDQAEEARIKARKTDTGDDAASAAAASRVAFERELQQLIAQQQEAELKGVGFTHEQIEAKKAAIEAQKQLNIWTEENNTIVGKGASARKKLSDEDFEILKRQQAITLAAKQEAEQRLAYDKAEEEDRKGAAAERQSALDYVNSIIQKNAEWGQSEHELAILKIHNISTSIEEEDKLLARLEQELIIKKKHADLDKERKKGEAIKEEATRLNERKDYDDQALSRLDKLKEAGLTKDVYTKMWKEIVEKGDTAMSALVNGMDIASQKMADAFSNFALTGKLAFKDMVASILADLARLMMQKAFAQLLEFGLEALAGTTSATYISGDSMSDIPTGSGNTGGSSYTAPGTPRAGGGPVLAGRDYVVGEKGPELFRPGTNGTIIPNGAGGGVMMSNTIIFQTDGSSSKRSDGDSDKRSKMIGDSLFEAMNQWAMVQRRPNGLLDWGATR